jgi:hypothetical protein
MEKRDSLAIKGFFDEPTNTVSYLVWDRATGKGAVIDPVLDFDHRSGKAWNGCSRRTLTPTISPPHPT